MPKKKSLGTYKSLPFKPAKVTKVTTIKPPRKRTKK
jgi:hypothetical protein